MSIKKDLWLVISATYDASTYTIPILAENKVSVGKYIREHVPDFIDYFIKMEFLDEDSGLIREGLKSWYHNIYFGSKIDKDEQYRSEFIRDIERVLQQIGDDNIVDEFGGYFKDTEGCFITIEKVKAKNIITL